MYLILFFTFVVSMLACHFIAKNKGRHPVAWGLSGAILGPLAVIIVLILPAIKS